MAENQKPAPAPQSPAEVQFWSGPEEPAQRLATSGIITFIRPDEFLVIQEAHRAIRVKPGTLPGGLAPGTRVEVSGFPVLGEYTVELEVLPLLMKGLTNPDIATALDISLGTAKAHVRAILAKLNAAERTEAASEAWRRGLLPPD